MDQKRIERDKLGQPLRTGQVIQSIGGNHLLYDGHPTQNMHQFRAEICGKVENFGMVSLADAKSKFELLVANKEKLTMITTCNGCKALQMGGRTFCALNEEIEVVQYVAGTAISWKPVHGMCAKPKTRAAYSAYLRAASTPPLATTS